MFIKKSFDEQIMKNYEYNLSQNHLSKKAEKLDKINQFLILSSSLLDEIGFEKEAIVVTKILEECENDPHIKDLDSTKMVNNLAETGWVFDANDIEDKQIEVHATYTPFTPPTAGEQLLQKFKNGADYFQDFLNSQSYSNDAQEAARKQSLNSLQKLMDYANDSYEEFINKKINDDHLVADIKGYIINLNQLAYP